MRLTLQQTARVPASLKMHCNTGTLQSSMVALCMCTIIFALHAVSVAAGMPLRAPKLTSESALRTPSEGSKQFMRKPNGPEGTMVPMLPFLVEHSEVISEVRGHDTQSGWAGPARRLLHGKRRPSKYSQCPACTMITCNGGGLCSGHCKRRRKQFTCRAPFIRTAAAFVCFDESPVTVPADTLAPLHSVAVAASAPFIGCANITGLSSGCPAAGTRGESTDGQRFTVLGSACEQYRYSLKQCEREEPIFTPFYPFGYCVCLTRSSSGSFALDACWLSDLRYTAPNARETGGVPVRVTREGNMTMTTFGVREELDMAMNTFSMNFSSFASTVDVEMVVWGAIVNKAENFTLDMPLAKGP